MNSLQGFTTSAAIEDLYSSFHLDQACKANPMTCECLHQRFVRELTASSMLSIPSLTWRLLQLAIGSAQWHVWPFGDNVVTKLGDDMLTGNRIRFANKKYMQHISGDNIVTKLTRFHVEQ